MANVRNIVTNLNGNVIINSESDNGARLQVTGSGTISGDWNASGYVTANGEGLGASLRVGGIYGDLGLYVPSTYDMQFDLGWNGSFKFTRANVDRFRIDSSGVLFSNSGYLAYGDGTFTYLYAPDTNGGITMGDATAPINVYYNDTHTFQSAGQLANYGGFTSTGFGVGTVAPSSKLEVVKQGNASGGTMLLSGSKTNNAVKYGIIATSQYASDTETEGVGLIGGVNTSTENIVVVGGGIDEINTATSIRFYAAANTTTRGSANERMRLTSNGNLLIGTTTDAGYKLRVNGTSYFDGLAWFGQSAGTGSAFRWGALGTAVSSDTMLSMNQIWNGSGWAILDSNVGTTYLNLGGAVASPSIDFGTGAQNTEATTKMRITNGGNVLIGTTTDAGYKLDVAGQARFGSGSKAIVGTDGTYGSYSTVGFGGTTNGYNRVFGFDGTSDGLYLASATGHGITFRVNGGSTDNVYINSSGNVGIGTGAPYGRLELYGSGQSWTTAPAIRMWDSFNEKGWLVGNVNNITPGDFYIRTLPSVSGAPGTGQQEFTIKHATGNVGIGTTSPSTRLDVLSSTSNSSIKTGGLEMQSYGVNNSWYAENLFFNGGTWQLRSTGYSTQMYMQGGTIDFNRTATGNGGDAVTLLTTMRLNNTGNVLIGTTTDVGAKLYVNGETRATSFTNAGPLGTGSANARNHFTQLNAGTASPSTGWIAAAFGDASADRIVIGQWTNGAQQAIFGAHTGNLNDWADVNYVAKNHKFYYNGDWSIPPGMTIDSSGNVNVIKLNASGNVTLTQDTNDLIFQQTNSSTHGIVWKNTSYAKDSASIRPTGNGAWATQGIGFYTGNAGDSTTAPSLRFNIQAGGDSIFYNNVGIGTTSPSAKFHLQGSNLMATLQNSDTAANQYTQLEFVAGSRSAYIWLGNQNSTSWAGDGGLNIYTTTGNMDLWTAGAQRMRITSGGNVLIGTTTDNGYKLRVNGKGYFDSNVVIAPVSESWAEGLSFVMPTTGTWGGLRWRRERVANDGNWYVGYTALDSTDDLVFGANNGGTQVDNIMRLTKAGNVGIGTTSPGSLLQVGNAGAAPTGLATLTLTGANTAPQIATKPGLYHRHAVGLGVFSDYAISFQVNGSSALSDAMYITNTGNVGIGTTSPTTEAKVHIVGQGTYYGLQIDSSLVNTGGSDNLFLRNTSSGNYVSIGLSANDSDGQHHRAVLKAKKDPVNAGTAAGIFQIDIRNTGASYTTALTVNALANVGIGTTTPDSYPFGGKLNVAGNISIDGTKIGWGVTDSFTLNGINTAHYGMSSNFNLVQLSGYYGLVLATNGAERMRISSNGNVGIGTTAPDTPLSSARGIVINSGASNDVQIRMQNNGTGSAGSDGGLLSISGSQMYLWNYEASNLIFGTNNSERMRIDSSGNIGIGTTSISYRVDISGDARILSGSLGVGVAPNATDGRIDASNDIVAYSTSDQRLKENVTPIENALEKVKTLTGVEFDWKEETAHVHGYHGHDVGIIAQDVQAVLPEAVRTNDSGYLSVRYEKMIALLIEGMKEQQNQIDELKAKLNGLTR